MLTCFHDQFIIAIMMLCALLGVMKTWLVKGLRCHFHKKKVTVLSEQTTRSVKGLICSVQEVDLSASGINNKV